MIDPKVLEAIEKGKKLPTFTLEHFIEFLFEREYFKLNKEIKQLDSATKDLRDVAWTRGDKHSLKKLEKLPKKFQTLYCEAVYLAKALEESRKTLRTPDQVSLSHKLHFGPTCGPIVSCFAESRQGL